MRILKTNLSKTQTNSGPFFFTHSKFLPPFVVGAGDAVSLLGAFHIPNFIGKFRHIGAAARSVVCILHAHKKMPPSWAGGIPAAHVQKIRCGLRRCSASFLGFPCVFERELNIEFLPA